MGEIDNQIIEIEKKHISFSAADEQPQEQGQNRNATEYKAMSNPLHRNDKVRVLENLFDPLTTFLSVPANSIGRILTFEDYCDYIKTTFDGKDTPEQRSKHFSQVANDIQGDRAFPVRVEYFAPAPDTVGPVCLEDVMIIGAQYLEKIEE